MTDAVGLALRIIDDARAVMDVGGGARGPLTGLPDVSEDGVGARSRAGRDMVSRIDNLDMAALPHELRLTVLTARARAAMWARERDWYWTVFDIAGSGLFTVFAASAYGGGSVISGLIGRIAGSPKQTPGERYRYLALVSDLAGLIDQLRERTEGQAERGILMPKPQAEAAIPLFEGLRDRAVAILSLPNERAGFDDEVRRLITERVEPAFDAFLSLLSFDYQARTSVAVGLSQYPDGADIYAQLVVHHTSLDVTPGQVHATGLERMAGIRQAMAEARRDAGFAGSDQDFRAALTADPRWRASTPEQIKAIFDNHISRFHPHYAALFNHRPSAGYGVDALPDALTGAMTFGFYRPPGPDSPSGTYFFNAVNLVQTGLYHLGAMTYHELVPGHHLQLAVQGESLGLHPVRRDSAFNAYAEGWAEYAATLAGELGLYAEPAERFGRLVTEAFLTCRLVVDTGMNALGWSLDQARDYMREHSFMSEQEILSETLRYSCDIPGQALAYKLGDREMLRLREIMRAALGADFHLHHFHDAVLAAGGLPFPLLEAHLRHVADQVGDATVQSAV